ncbi:MAG: serine/threonine protein kinase, partial [Planctomycetes bacterium]|nr:serine/threonine protein kinase [Planctomycetota bacterium]
MGSVYLGTHEETGEKSAVKVLPASLAREEGFVARFAREIESMKQLDNPHIVKFIDSGVDDETYFYAMEYVDGETLTNILLKEKRLPWEKVVEYAIQICSALKAAHDTGIVHRDLKPSNLLIDKDDQVKLTDFGVAQVFAAGKLTVTGGIIGTAEYMSPEQAMGTRASKKSDLYSLGAVMYAMICGRPPFSGKTTLEVIQKHKFGQFDRPNMYVPEIPLWLNDIVCQLLEKEPDKRFPDAYVLSRRLQEKMHQHQLKMQDATLNATGQEELGSTVVSGMEGVDPNDPNATLMRDLMRAQVEAAMQKGPISHILDNTLVLVLLLALVVVGGLYLVGGNSPSATSEETEETIASLEEPERLVKVSDHYREIGDYERSLTILQSLETLLSEQGDEGSLKKRIQIKIKQVEKAIPQADGLDSFLERSLARAQQSLENQKPEEAKKICQSIVSLYADDPGATRAVDEARKMLESLE